MFFKTTSKTAEMSIIRKKRVNFKMFSIDNFLSCRHLYLTIFNKILHYNFSCCDLSDMARNTHKATQGHTRPHKAFFIDKRQQLNQFILIQGL